MWLKSNTLWDFKIPMENHLFHIVYICVHIASPIFDIDIPTTMLYSTFDNPVDVANSSCNELHLRLVDD